MIKKEVDATNFYDFIWVDKGVFITDTITKQLSKQTSKLIHFTPDPSFYYHQSTLFNKSLKYYDFAITTKSFEIKNYQDLFDGKVILTTQGYDEDQHKSLTKFEDKKYDFSFVGHFEINRAIIIRKLLKKGYRILLAGPRWYLFSLFIKSKNLCYIGKYLKGEKYTKAISDAYMSIGFLSKWIPEQHTTRTFEIPACGTLLVTEKTKEIETFFSDEEVLFYNNFFELEDGAKNLLLNKLDLQKKIVLSQSRINNGGFSHRKILIRLINETGIA